MGLVCGSSYKQYDTCMLLKLKTFVPFVVGGSTTAEKIAMVDVEDGEIANN